jgi:mono/diheme cytochrome c family protein
MNSSDRPKRFNSARRWWCVIACATAILTAATARPASADCPCGKQWPHLICRHGPSHATGPGDIMNADTGGTWYWVRSPEQERRVVMNLYNRYCIRCHGVDGRGVWDIPDVPDFTHPVWQTTRSDDYRSRVILEGRGAVMPAFRGTLTLEEACAMARYLHTFAPGTEVSRPDLGTAAATPPAGNPPGSAIPVPPIQAPATSTPGAFNR